MRKFATRLAWAAVAVVAAYCLAGIAIQRGERINSLWLVLASSCTYLVGFQVYAKVIFGSAGSSRRAKGRCHDQ